MAVDHEVLVTAKNPKIDFPILDLTLGGLVLDFNMYLILTQKVLTLLYLNIMYIFIEYLQGILHINPS